MLYSILVNTYFKVQYRPGPFQSEGTTYAPQVRLERDEIGGHAQDIILKGKEQKTRQQTLALILIQLHQIQTLKSGIKNGQKLGKRRVSANKGFLKLQGKYGICQ